MAREEGGGGVGRGETSYFLTRDEVKLYRVDVWSGRRGAGGVVGESQEVGVRKCPLTCA